ncbi:hypothetical protein GAY33_14695 [Azospirillum brasilense]|uniref:gp53-like domain-containing protein n=1 Tax=Azospirillum argentinense TaxID=2970906 RepID=UPI00190AC873|nr:hypothetical protein [Azospirillum argentinense]MBK3800467.1 hypothetical protein [Azospirillum argentinense]
MAGDQLQFRGGTAVEHSAFTGALREVTVDTTNKALRVHDGLTPGGFMQALADLSNVTASANLPMAGFKITGLGTPTAAGDGATKGYVDGASSLAGSGYIKFPNGLILQWGNGPCAANGNTSLTFPIAFPNNCYRVIPIGAQGSGGVQAYVTFNSATLTGFVCNCFLASSGQAPVLAAVAGSVNVEYFAIGR